MDINSINAENTRMIQGAQQASMLNKVMALDVQLMSDVLSSLPVAGDPSLGQNIDLQG